MTNKSNHTPGPWEVGQSYPEGLEGHGDYVYAVLRPVAPDALHSTHLSGWGGLFRKADALLIAAAPELLKAVERLMQAVNAGSIRIPAEIGMQASAAVAKARGEEVRP